MRVRIHRFDLACGAGNRGGCVTDAIADDRVFCIKTGFKRRSEGRARHFGVHAFIPFNLQCIESRFRPPPRVSNDCDRTVTNAQHFHDTGPFEHGRVINALHFAAENRAVLNRCVEHARQFEIHAVDLLAGRFVDGVEAGQTLADDLPVFRILERNVLRGREFRGGVGDLAIRGCPLRRAVSDHAFADRTFNNGNFPLVGCRLNQHHARGRTALTHIVL